MELKQNERTVDFMDETVFMNKSRCAQKENPKPAISKQLSFVSQSDEEIINFVVNEMKDTVG